MERILSQFFTPETVLAAGGGVERFLLDPAVTGLVYDSRKAEPGNLYFALPGVHYDGHAFAGEAVSRGAVVIVHQRDLAEYLPGVVYCKVRDSRFAMSPIAAAFYGFPSCGLPVIGVTGTEGKSTTVYLTYQLLKRAGKSAGFISTVQFDEGAGERWNPEHQTTPEAVTVQRFLAGLREARAEYAVLESSSHGLSPKTNRLGDVVFTAGIMTNVTHEHLEFHGTWERYREDKANLFRKLDQGPENAFGVVNADDPSAEYFAASTNRPVYTFSVCGKPADVSLQNIESGSEGNQYTVYIRETGETVFAADCLPGAFNAGNVLASLLTVSVLLALPVKELIPLVSKLKPVRGRMTAVKLGQPFEVLVDFAHTPSSFQAVLPPLRKRLDARGGRLISLFGSAGERDAKKRSLQGKVAAEWSDIAILTDEDPRGEDPIAILEEIAQGIPDGKRNETLFLLPDRPTAIRKAFALARPGDAVVLLGKGHENSIIYAREVKPYDEIGEAEKALAELGYGKTER
ncbi:MAG: UDP-N-acetylmuramoyl-L-alanyl-D-glutamate--2,6-diaminopimelate ligase [Spirochaetaceae bacterium]|jgi:UDP-N-acetylmuramoyl-L-alanyl-D-glutamate--2,6-diaminopimelate ligase|nr:UDP-N-acetylmuramoyl-L-alanyl-D-glutamate--2,6-diaminopimelate ligase [Spirochaetaceae bacterium]